MCTHHVGILVDDAAEAFRISTENGAIPVRLPATLRDDVTGTSLVFAEIKLYGDCVLRFVSGDFEVGRWGAEWRACMCGVGQGGKLDWRNACRVLF